MAGVTSVVIDGTTYLVDDINAVDFSEDQGLSEQQQEQGRSNIGAAAEAALAGKADKADLDVLAGTVGELSDDVEGLTEAMADKADKADVEELTEQLADKADVIVDTASGAIASFPDGAAVAAKDITIGIEPLQAGSGDPSPTNVRPISGWTGANVTRTGFNVWDEEWEVGAINDAGVPVAYANDIRSKNFSRCVSDCSYYMHKPSRVDICWYDENKTFISKFKNSSGMLASPANAKYFKIDAVECGPTYNYDISINYPATNTEYHPYTGNTYPISWQSEAGTVYGGTLDVTTGLLTVTMAEVDLGTLDWKRNGDRFQFFSSNIIPAVSDKNGKSVVCSGYASGNAYNGGYNNFTICIAESNPRVFVTDDRFTDNASFKAAMSGVQLVYELATPQTYQLTPTEVTLLLGDNNVWADTGDSTVTYRADTKLYIQKINAPTDNDMIADAQIASGKYFIIGGNLYKSTTTIPAGDTITPGTNCILTNLADALNALNT